MVLTNSWSGVRDGENGPPAKVAKAHGWRFRRDSTRNGETRKWRKHGQLRALRAERGVNGWVGVVAGRRIGSPSQTKGVSAKRASLQLIDSS